MTTRRPPRPPRPPRRARWTLALLALLATLVVSPDAAAQKKEKPPKRPKLDQYADTNDWQAYYADGLAKIERRPDKAAESFYWAMQLDPSRAEPILARWTALWLADRPMLREYLGGAEFVVNSGKAQRIDSLAWEARLRNPYVHQGLRRVLIAAMYDDAYGRGNWSWSGDPENEAWLAYTERRFADAIARTRQVLEKKPNRYDLHLDLALNFHGMQRYDSAAAALGRVIDEMRARDRKRLVYFYNSKTMLSYQLGITHMLMRNYDAARAAFGEALAEDLSFYMGHGALGGLALAQGDTATAISEYDQAVQLQPSDPVLRTDFGLVLLAAKQYEAAVEHLGKAVELAPYFATPVYYRAVALEYAGRQAEALPVYRRYLAMAPISSPQIRTARDRVAALEGTK